MAHGASRRQCETHPPDEAREFIEQADVFSERQQYARRRELYTVYRGPSKKRPVALDVAGPGIEERQEACLDERGFDCRLQLALDAELLPQGLIHLGLRTAECGSPVTFQHMERAVGAPDGFASVARVVGQKRNPGAGSDVKPLSVM